MAGHNYRNCEKKTRLEKKRFINKNSYYKRFDWDEMLRWEDCMKRDINIVESDMH